MKIYASVPQIIVRETTLKNKDGSMAREQAVLLHVEGKLAPLECSVLLRGGTEPFQVGNYEIDPGSFGSGQYGRLEFRLRLGVKVAAQLAKAA